MTRRTRAVLAGLLLAATVLAACSQDDSDSSSRTRTTETSGAEATRPDATAPAGDAFRIGLTAQLSGANSIAYRGLEMAVDAWEQSVNKQGGINGHPVEVFVEDTGGDAAKGLATVQELVESDRIQALVLLDPATDNAVHTYTQEQQIPVVSPFASYPIWNSTPGWFALGIPAFPQSIEATIDILLDEGASSVGAVVCAEVAACGAVDSVMNNLAETADVRYDGAARVAASAPNYTAECLLFADKKTEVIYLGTAGEVARRFAEDCASQGYNPSFLFPYHAFQPANLEIEDISAIGLLPTVPWYANVPATRDFRRALKQYGEIEEADETSMYAWVSLEAIREALQQAQLTPEATRAQVIDAMSNLRTDLGGLISEVSFAPGQPSPAITCYFLGAIENGKFTTPDGTEPKCLD